MASIWVIEEGEYSDYRVVGVFTSKENADAVCSAINGGREWGGATVAEWPLNPAIEELNQGLYRYRVVMRKDGDVERVERQSLESYNMVDDVTIWRRSLAPFYRGSGAPDAMVANVWASDEKHAIKVVNEKRAQWIATGKWDE